MEGEVYFSQTIKAPKDVSEDFFDRFGEFLDETKSQIKSCFSELLSFKRAVFSLEIAAPIKQLHEIERFLKKHGYQTWNKIDGVEKNDENREFFPQELFNRYPNEIMGASLLFISCRTEFIYLAKLAEHISCSIPERGDPRAAFRGLLYGYCIQNIIGFIEQKKRD